MRTFRLHLQDASQYRLVEDAVSFMGEDASGGFGLQAHHQRFMTSLIFGLARYRTADGVWHYVVLPGGLLYFRDNDLFIATRRFFQDDNLQRIMGEYEQKLRREEEAMRQLKDNLHQLEQEMLRRLWRIEAVGAGTP